MDHDDAFAAIVTQLSSTHRARHRLAAVAHVVLQEWVRHGGQQTAAGRFTAVRTAHERLRLMPPTHAR